MAQKRVLRNARLIDGLADQPREGVSIVLDGERIASIEENAEIDLPDAEVVDLGGKTVLPGLIDTHVHTTLIPREHLTLFLAAGVTTARDLGGDLNYVQALRDDLATGKQLGPRLLIYGPLLDGLDESFPRNSPLGPILDNIPAPEAVPAKVSALLRAGVDGIKCYFTLPPETLRAVIQFVDKRVPVTGHLGYTHSLDAIEAGIDGLEHVWISPYNEFCALDMRFGPGASMMDPAFWAKTLKGWENADLDAPLARTWFAAMVEKQVAMGTTLDLLWPARCGPEGVRSDPDQRYTYTALTGSEVPAAEAAGLFDAFAGRAALEKHQDVTRLLHEAGGLVVGGTDCGALSYPPPGFALLREVELLAEPLGAMAALKAVTSEAARAIRREDDVGSVAPGRYADLLVVDGDPLRDVTELRNLVSVYRGGERHDPASLLNALST